MRPAARASPAPSRSTISTSYHADSWHSPAEHATAANRFRHTSDASRRVPTTTFTPNRPISPWATSGKSSPVIPNRC